MRRKTTTYLFEYSQGFRDAIIELHRGSDRLPFYQDYIEAHLGGPNSRLNLFGKYLLPEISHHCGDLNSKRALDLGCGTGAMTAVLAMNCKEVIAFDVDDRSSVICQARLKEHGLTDRVSVLCAADFGDVIEDVGTFDLVLLNGVIEHIPLSQKGHRKKLMEMAFEVAKVGGYLYINGTPNRLWPIDFHTTKLWWIPWTRPGSKWAYSKAVRRGRHLVNSEGHSEGPLGLEERGAWGATIFEIKKYLSGRNFQIVNSLPGHNRHISYSYLPLYRKLFDFIVYYAFSKWTGIPLTALGAGLDNLVIQKLNRE